MRSTDWLHRSCPGKNLTELAEAKLLFVPLNLSAEWHWHLLVIDYVNESFSFYDSLMSRGYKNASNSPRNTHEKEQVDLVSVVIALMVFDLQIYMYPILLG